MAVGPSTYLANKLLDTYCNATSFSVATPYIKLHLGAPGAAGTTNPAVNTTRKLVSFAAAGTNNAGEDFNDTAVTWTNVPATEDYTHWSLWDASSAGNFLQSGTISGGSVTIADDFDFPIGELLIALAVAS